MIRNKTILITGAASGLGSDLYECLKDDNYLILIGRSDNKKYPESDHVKNIITDITDGTSLEQKISEVIKVTGRTIDGIVNAAAVPDRETFSATTYETIRNVISTKIIGYANTIKACLPHLNNHSSIVNIASVHAYSTSADSRAAYSAANAGVIGLTKALSVSLDFRNKTRVNVICPGGFLTEEYKASYPDWEQKLAKNQILPVRDVTNVVLFLLSDESKGINGAEMKVETGVGNLRASSANW